MRGARGLFRLGRAPCALIDAGFMSPELLAAWVGAAEGLYDHKPQMQRDEAIRSATFGAGHFYMPPSDGFGACPMTGFDPVAVASNSAFSPMEFQDCWLRLVEQLPITGRKKADAR